ncbi:MAG: biosynthetic-type acetolactate synthase large subunit [Gammaproteobacteria bacterium]|jgi:acetolactate synthase-1/2/3 large subunit|tara:strand:+ start:103 stop:1818 length:1716 start_codon:yes stop_codon:yes gene_type:complete
MKQNTENNKEKFTGAEIFVKCLEAEGIDLVFGYPGGAVLHIYDELHKQNDVTHILVRHEQGAVHAAEGFAKSSDKPGVVLVTSGPGATNAITGIADAYMDSVPIVVFTGQVRTALIGNDAFQEVDTVGITRPCVKHNFMITDVKDMASTIKKAFYVASSGRPGPVVVDIPKDITEDSCEFIYPSKVSMRSYNPNIEINENAVDIAVDKILRSNKPVIYAGGGVINSNASQELTNLAKYLNFPVTNTLMGLGCYPGDDSQFLQMLGMHGSYEANMAMHDCDLLIAVGARFDDRITGRLDKFSPDATVVHIDVDPSSISKNIKAHIPIVGDVKGVLEKIASRIISKKRKPQNIEKWWEQINEWRKKDSFKYSQDDEIIKPQFVIDRLYEITKGDAFITSDVGQHQMWAAQLYKFNKPKRWINSGGLGTMGFGLPSAMGVQFANPDSLVCCVTGEASIQMCIQELSTCLQYGLPIKIINLNNRYMGMVRQWQEFFYEKRYAMSYMDALPDFVKLAESFGHIGLKVEKPSDVDAAIKDAIKLKDRLVFIDFITDQNENVFPMIATGAAHNKMILS